jgi:hypothetical protein
LPSLASTEEDVSGERVAGPQYIPSRGDRIEQTRVGIRRTGTVWYADQLQLLVKWDGGCSSSLRLGATGVRILEHDSTPAAAKVSEVARLRVSDPELVPELIAFLHTRSDVGAARVGKDEVEVSLHDSDNEASPLLLDLLVRAWEEVRSKDTGVVEFIDE